MARVRALHVLRAMPPSGPDLEVGDTTSPYVPTRILHERTQVFARPSSQYPLATPDDDGDPTTLFDRNDRHDEVPTVRGRQTRSYAAYGAQDERTTTPARPSQQSAVGTQRRSVPPPFRRSR